MVLSLFIAFAGIPVQGPPGVRPDGSQMVPTGEMLRPYGKTLEVHGRPVDAAFSAYGRLLFVKDMDMVRVVDAASWKQLQELKSPGGASIYGIALSKDASHIF